MTPADLEALAEELADGDTDEIVERTPAAARVTVRSDD